MSTLFPAPSDAGDNEPAIKDDDDDDTYIGAPLFPIAERAQRGPAAAASRYDRRDDAGGVSPGVRQRPCAALTAADGVSADVPGSLVSGAHAAPPGVAETTVKVRRKKRSPTPTTFVRASTTSTIVYIVAVLIAGIVGALIALLV